MALRDWFQQEWRTQWPLVRFEVYRWGVVVVFGVIIAVATRVLHSLLGIEDVYFYGGVLIVSCVTLYFVTGRLKQFLSTTGQAQKVIQQRVSQTTIASRVPLYALLVLSVLVGVWNVVLQRHVRHLEIEMKRFVLPRQLTKEQINAFGKYLASHSEPHEVKLKYILGDGEAERYAEDFAAAFKVGNWLPTISPVNPAALTCRAVNPPVNDLPFMCSTELQQMANRLEGISVDQTGLNAPPPSTLEEKLHPPPYVYTIVLDAIRAANIQGIGGSYGYSNEPFNTLTLSIGFRPRDKWGVLPPDFYKRHEEFPRDITDDDF